METFDELYYREPFTREFDATVTACKRAEKGYEVELDDTAFYPEGGGQPGDRGTFAWGEPTVGEDGVEQRPHAQVLDTVKRGERTVQLTDAPVPAGTEVHGTLDWTWRRDNMEAHTGEHIVSGIVHGLFGYENVGFHMGERRIEVDFDGILDDEQALDVERRANAAVRADVAVNILVPSVSELAAMDYRSKKELEGPVRIVDIPGVDRCACCGTHVGTTGQVGLIKILRVSSKKKKTRLELLCGRRALLAVEDETAQLRGVSNFLSVGDDEAEEAVRRLAGERDELKHGLRRAHHAAIDQEVATLAPAGRLLVRDGDGLDIEEQRYLCERVLEAGVAEVCAVLSKGAGKSAGRLNYVIASSETDLRPTCKKLNARLQGRGGGKPQMVQGSFAASRDGAETALREVLG